MTEVELQESASGGDEIKAQRQILRNEVHILEEGLFKCQQHRHRLTTKSGKSITFATIECCEPPLTVHI